MEAQMLSPRLSVETDAVVVAEAAVLAASDEDNTIPASFTISTVPSAANAPSIVCSRHDIIMPPHNSSIPFATCVPFQIEPSCDNYDHDADVERTYYNSTVVTAQQQQQQQQLSSCDHDTQGIDDDERIVVPLAVTQIPLSTITPFGGASDIPVSHNHRRTMLCKSIFCGIFVIGFVLTLVMSELVKIGDPQNTATPIFISTLTTPGATCDRPAEIDTEKVSNNINGVSYEVTLNNDIQISYQFGDQPLFWSSYRFANLQECTELIDDCESTVFQCAAYASPNMLRLLSHSNSYSVIYSDDSDCFPRGLLLSTINQAQYKILLVHFLSGSMNYIQMQWNVRRQPAGLSSSTTNHNSNSSGCL
jgi:hypothetical protein